LLAVFRIGWSFHGIRSSFISAALVVSLWARLGAEVDLANDRSWISLAFDFGGALGTAGEARHLLLPLSPVAVRVGLAGRVVMSPAGVTTGCPLEDNFRVAPVAPMLVDTNVLNNNIKR
jgi:hypothetical protein